MYLTCPTAVSTHKELCVLGRGEGRRHSGVHGGMEEQSSSGKAKLLCLTSRNLKDKYIPYHGMINNKVQESLFE